MCGIAGLFRAEDDVSPEDMAAVECATFAQSHRGPDDSGFYRDERVVLGFRRLSIIDLSTAGHQPMSNEDGTVWVIYNGEIYNYPELRPALKARGHDFRSNSDTEILLHGYEEWGIEGLLQRLRGMYAFALYDSHKACCILVRDRFGIKPLYYIEPPGERKLAFASEVKALVRSGLAPSERDPDGIAGFLLFGSVPSPMTSTRGVRCLMPSHYLVADRGGTRTRKYWSLEFGSQSMGEETAAGLKLLLEDSVKRHLISDVPLGVFLSGGVDSAGLVALASQQRARLTTVTVVFDEEEFSEAAPARRVAECFGTDHREIRVTGQDFIRELPGVLAAMDQPSSDGVNTYFVSQAARQAGLTVVLSGLGGDEVFWGYKHYRWLSAYQSPVRWLSKMPALLRRPMAAGAAAYGRTRGRENWMRLQALDRRVGNEELYSVLRGFFAPAQVARLLDLRTPELRAIADAHFASIRPALTNGLPTMEGINRIEMQRYLHDQLLRDTDVFSMAHSLEVRVPYLDHAVVECAARLPGASKVNGGTVNKPVLVNAIGNPLLVELAKQRKQGFAFPFAKWMKQNAGELSELARQTDILDRSAVDGMWQSFAQGRLHWSRAWALTVLGAGRASSAPRST